MKYQFEFDRFERDFHTASAESVKLLAERYGALPFYAICVYVDSFDGEFALYANTNAHFEKILRYYRRLSDWADRCANPDIMKSMKYNCGNFEYQTIGCPEDFRACFEKTMEPWSSVVHDISYNRGGLTTEDYRRFDELACRVAISLASSEEVALLKRTDDFMMLVASAEEWPLAAVHRLKWFEEYGSLKGFQPSHYSVAGDM